MRTSSVTPLPLNCRKRKFLSSGFQFCWSQERAYHREALQPVESRQVEAEADVQRASSRDPMLILEQAGDAAATRN